MFRRTYIGHGTQSSVFVFQGHPGPFRTHVHKTHDEIGYVLAGTGEVRVGGVTRPVKAGDVWVIPANTPHGGSFEDAPQVLFISSPDRRPGQPGPRLAGRLMADLLPVIRVPKGSVTPYVLTVGDPDRAAAVGELLEGARQLGRFREYHTWQGAWKGLDLTVTSHGVGGAGAAVAFEELILGGAQGDHPPRHVRLVPGRDPVGRPARRDRRRSARTASRSSCCR